jgi:murein DD-endopeptidase MepM/ murein hydrolase activator NlpD
MSQNNLNAKRSILTQNKLSAVSKMKLHWLFFALLLPIVVLIATLSAAPDSEAAYVPVQTVVSDIDLPLPTSQENRNEIFWQTDLVRNKDTLDKLFNRMGVRDDDAIKFLTFSPDSNVINTQLIPGRSVAIKTNTNGKLLHLEYELPENEALIASLTPEGYRVATQKLALEKHEVYKSADIRSSLFSATDDAGIPDQVALKIADIFSSQIDFNEDLRSGDKFNVVYEAFYNAGELVKIGDVLAVEFLNNGKKYQAIHFGNADSKYAYYTPDGNSLHKSFLRSPLEFTRVSSSFNRGRFHPVLHRVRAHKGVDLAARMGTRIKASGDGEVAFVGRKGGYGNVIILKHPNGISTVYGHLSRFASGLHRGSKVEQSDIIGYVGMSGLATGPHLHYEFLLNGVHRDPMTVALPTSVPLEAKYRDEFDAQALEYLAKIEMLNRHLIASSD